MSNKGVAKEKTIIGTVRPYEWDEDDNVVGVCIVDGDDEEFVVQSDDKGQQLLDYLDYDVSVSGLVREAGGERWIAVRRFTQVAVDDLFEEWEDEEAWNDR
jgi:hypothetical protein